MKRRRARAYLVRAVSGLVRRPTVASGVLDQIIAERDAIELSALASVRIPPIVRQRIRHHLIDIRLCQTPRSVNVQVILLDKRQRVSPLRHEGFQLFLAIGHGLDARVHHGVHYGYA